MLSCLAFHSSGSLFAGSYDGGVFRSFDNGDLWTPINTGITTKWTLSLVINAAGHVFAGTYDGGVFRSTDNGDHWTPLNEGLTSPHIWSLTINSSGYLFAGTGGGGVYRNIRSTTAANKETNKQNLFSYELMQNYPNPFSPLTTIRYTLPKTEYVTLTIYKLSGQTIETLVSEQQGAGDHDSKWTRERHPSGVYFYKLQAGAFSQTKKLIVQ